MDNDSNITPEDDVVSTYVKDSIDCFESMLNHPSTFGNTYSEVMDYFINVRIS